MKRNYLQMISNFNLRMTLSEVSNLSLQMTTQANILGLVGQSLSKQPQTMQEEARVEVSKKLYL